MNIHEEFEYQKKRSENLSELNRYSEYKREIETRLQKYCVDNKLEFSKVRKELWDLATDGMSAFKPIYTNYDVYFEYLNQFLSDEGY